MGEGGYIAGVVNLGERFGLGCSSCRSGWGCSRTEEWGVCRIKKRRKQIEE